MGKPEYSKMQKELEKYLKEYKKFLVQKYTYTTVNRHIYVIDNCIEYLVGYSKVENFEEIKLSHISSKFYNYFIGHTAENMTRKTVFNIVKKFFEFIQKSQEINSELMRKIAKAKIK